MSVSPSPYPSTNVAIVVSESRETRCPEQSACHQCASDDEFVAMEPAVGPAVPAMEGR